MSEDRIVGGGGITICVYLKLLNSDREDRRKKGRRFEGNVKIQLQKTKNNLTGQGIVATGFTGGEGRELLGNITEGGREISEKLCRGVGQALDISFFKS